MNTNVTSTPAVAGDDDQRRALDALNERIDAALEDLDGESEVVALMGQAGAGKTHVIAQIIERLRGVSHVTDKPAAATPDDIAACIVTPTHRAARVLKMRGVPEAVTAHAALLQPVWRPIRAEVENWLRGRAEDRAVPAPDPAVLSRYARKRIDGGALEEAARVYTRAAPDGEDAAWSAALTALEIDEMSAFLAGWRLRDGIPRLAVLVVEEASMVSADLLAAMAPGARLVILVGDDKQLAPIGPHGGAEPMSFEVVPQERRSVLTKNRRAGAGSEIAEVARFVADTDNSKDAVRDCLRSAIANNGAIEGSPYFSEDLLWAGGGNVDPFPGLCFRNIFRVALWIKWRERLALPEYDLVAGEPLIVADVKGSRCDNIYKNAGLTVVDHVPGKRLRVQGETGEVIDIDGIVMEVPNIERTVQQARGAPPPRFYAARRRNARRFVFMRHGAAATTHSVQGGQAKTVQIGIKDYLASTDWRRLLYVGLTRAEERVRLVTSDRPGFAKRLG